MKDKVKKRSSYAPMVTVDACPYSTFVVSSGFSVSFMFGVRSTCVHAVPLQYISATLVNVVFDPDVLTVSVLLKQ